jgi:hypothetical protein
MLQRQLKNIDRRSIFLRRFGDLLEVDLPALAKDVVVHLGDVQVLLFVLLAHPVRESGKPDPIAIGRHRQIKVRRVEFLVHLFIQGFLHFF